MPGILRRRLGSPHHRAVFNLPSSLSSPEKVQLGAAQRGVVLLLCTWQRRWLPEPPRTERGGSWERGWHGEGRYTHSKSFNTPKEEGNRFFFLFDLWRLSSCALRARRGSWFRSLLSDAQPETIPLSFSTLLQNIPGKARTGDISAFIFPPPKLRSDGEAARASGVFNKSGC